MNIDELLRYAAKYGASDLHITAGNPPIIRVNGRLKKIPGPALTAEDAQLLVYSILSDEQRAAVERKRELDLSYTWGEASHHLPPEAVTLDYISPERVRARVNVFLDLGGVGAAFRIIPAKIRTLDELPAPASVAELTRSHSGLVLVTGPTGCGKSTTLASMIDLIDQERAVRIITIEDPIEYIFQPRNCLISQREIGTHSRSFAAALRACLREDPDVILVGEMRDLETISLALTAAETGHLVLSTLHTNNVAQTVDRVIDVFPADQQEYVRQIFANVIRGIISQTLLPRKDGRGRVAAMEVLVATPAVKNLIREAKTHQIPSLVQTGSQYGMQTMDQCLESLMAEGLIAPEVAYAVASDKKLFTPPASPVSPPGPKGQ
ncbi:MAG: type IV pilus twitching motility protein PilT [candidate division WOR-3 bacterium]|jgi:twitching motility protein PilT|nr:type IV pilus twitching motility protein PilT [candidate division WOR-3 bacterium]MCR4424329.1 type IV pilus twitching motility protein PilT [candidate division WOR-3 bacterium]MDH7518147.1 type IV pilus twitching motility protein PilT [bacterium]